MSSFTLKLIAICTMLIDHCTLAAYNSGFIADMKVYTFLRAVGRPAFPIFAFLLTEGFYKSSNRKAYFTRLCAFAVLSQPAFSMLANAANYEQNMILPSCTVNLPQIVLLLLPPSAWFVFGCGKKPDSSVLWLEAALLLSQVRAAAFGLEILNGQLNVFYTLAFGMAAMMEITRLKEQKAGAAEVLCCGTALAVVLPLVQYRADYDISGIVLILGLYFCAHNRRMQLWILAVWSLNFILVGAPVMFAFSVLSVPAVLLYNGERGKSMKYMFYAFYPVHLSLLVFLFQVLYRK